MILFFLVPINNSQNIHPLQNSRTLPFACTSFTFDGKKIHFASTLPVSVQPPKQKLSIVERVDRFVANLPDEFNGTILLAIGDKILMNKGYGMANRSFNIPNTSKTKYELASVTKDFTTVLAFKLVEMGLIKLDETIDKYLPYFPKDKASKIKIRHLLLHQSGIRHHIGGIPNFIGFHDRIYHTPRELLELFWDKDLAHEPGKGTTYSSPGYWLLTIIMEIVSGKSFSELLNEHILRPLGMKNTHVDNNLTVHKNLAIGYKRGLCGYVMDLKEEHSNNLGAGDMISTTGDLFRFQRILSPKSGSVLSLKTWQLLFKEQYRINDWLVRTMLATLAQIPYNKGEDTLLVYGIGAGGNYGFQSRLTRLVDHDATYIVLSNTHNDRTMNEQLYSFLQDILCEELGIPLKTHKPLGPLAPESKMLTKPPIKRLNMYEGIFRVNSNDIIHVFVKNGNLHYRGYKSSYHGRIEVRGGELIPLYEDTFFDRNGWFPQYFLFLKPSELTADHRYASMKRFFTNTQDTNRYQLIRRGFQIKVALRWSAEATPNSKPSDYQGEYFSTELQKTYDVILTSHRLVARDFLGIGDVELTPLKTDLFYCDQGFLVFHRYKDGEIRDFWLMSENLDHVYGSLFIKKR